MILFVDTSALVKLYIAEPGSERMHRATRDTPVAVSELAFAEIHATFARRRREALLLPDEYTLLRQHLGRDWDELIQVPIGSAALALVPALCEHHPLRGADALQLASALTLVQEGLEVTFACCDGRLLEAAAAEELTVFDPTREE